MNCLNILCFNHCGSNIFCLKVLEICPICSVPITEDCTFTSLNHPFVTATQHPAAIFIKPTIGDFFSNNIIHSDLHIGLSTSRKSIVEYDADGLRVSPNSTDKWQQCIKIFEVEDAWHDHWDKSVVQICADTKWSSENYDESGSNCFTFVLDFLRLLEHPKLTDALGNKIQFCEKFILQKLSTVNKYIKIRNRLKHVHFINC